MFLEKLFIKDYKETQKSEVRFKYGIVAGIFGLLSNILLFVGKIVIGLIGKSITVIADAINNLADAGSSVVTMFGFKMSAKPADYKHPYGYARYEYITALVVALIIFMLGVLLGKSSVEKIIAPETTDVTLATYIILSLAVVLKLYQFFVYRRFAKAIDSESLKASSVDALTDTISTFTVLIATILIDFLPNVKVSIDGIFGLIVSVLIISSSIKLISSTVKPLIGEKPDEELVKKIKKKLLSYDGVLGIHDLMIHNYGEGRNFALVHVEVPANRDIMESHELIDNIEQEFKNKMGIHLSIHLDPIEIDNPLVNKLRLECAKILKDIDDDLTMHDFRVVVGTARTNIVFDVVVPFYEAYSSVDLAQQFKLRFHGDENMEYYFIIDIDRDYISPPEEEEEEEKERDREDEELERQIEEYIEDKLEEKKRRIKK